MVILLALTQSLTRDIMETRQDPETVGLLRGVFTSADSYTLTDDIYTVYDDDLHILGYAFYVRGMGYNNWFKILVGLEDEATLEGIVIIYHGEHPNSDYTHQGDLADLTPWSLQFAGLAIENCYLKQGGGVVDAVTTATIGTRAMTDAIREAALEKAEVIAGW